MIEIEVKLKVDNWDNFVEQLEKAGGVFSAPIIQEDIIYTRADDISPWTSSTVGTVVLRLRQQGDKTIFTLKQQRSHELDNLELETVIEDREEMKHILELLGFTPEVEVKKVRRKCKFKEYEICLDEVEKLGKFVEIEKLTDETADTEAVEKELLQVLVSYGLASVQQERRGYDTQLFQLTHKL